MSRGVHGRGTSPYRDDDSYDDTYSEDFEDDDAHSNRRYKTKSPLQRTASSSGHKKAQRPKDSRHSDSNIHKQWATNKSSAQRPYPALGDNTYRKARGGMSLASGYLTPTEENHYLTPRSKVSIQSEREPSRHGRQTGRRVASEYTAKKGSSYRSNRSRGRGHRAGGRMTGRSSQEPKFDNVAKRVMSARRLKINELINKNQELQMHIQEVKDENKILKKMQHQQDKALKKFEEQESDLPQLIQRQNNESRALKDQIRKWREKFEKTDRYLRDAEDELEKVKAKMKKLKMLADEKDLPERTDLNKRLNKADLDMEEKDVRIKELERHVQNLEKNHRHELGIERARQRDVNKQIQTLRDQNEKLSTDVKEKDKELQMKNIYANRMVKPPHRLPNSYSGTPHGTPPPVRKRRQSLNEGDGMTPRDRAKQMEEKRREELRRQRELKQQPRKNIRPAPVHPSSRRTRDSSPSSQRETSRSHDRSRDKTPQYRDDTSVSHSHRGQQHEKMKREQDLRSMREREDRERDERERRQREEDERREWEEKEQRMNEEARQEEDERRKREERERSKREADERERQRREEQERREKEERQRREKREREERERRERERLEQERRAQEERRRFEDDVSLQAERRKKDDILQKLREIDEGGQKPKEKNGFNDPFFVTQDKEQSNESMGSKKSYKFTKPIENLHKGKPAKEKNRDRSVDDITTGGYNPTFNSSRDRGNKSTTNASKTFSLFDDDEPKVSNKGETKPGQKSKLMEELFGSKDSGPKHNDIFAPSKPAAKKSQADGRPTAFPWEDSKSVKTSNLNTKRENSSTLFGGGSALINDEDFSNNKTSSTQMRRPKQTTTTFHTRPTVNAVDHFDDDIEEVML